MKSFLPLLTFAVLLTSCSSVYKSGQTPDDVYFSPERPREEYVRVDDRDDRRYEVSEEENREDRYLRMKTRNRRYGLLEDNYDCYCYTGNNYMRYNDYNRMNAVRYNQSSWMWNTRYAGFYGFDPFFANPYYFNPYYSNPYYSGVVYGNVNPKYNRPRTSNLNIFDGNTRPSNSNKRSRSVFSIGSDRNDNYRGSGSNAGGFMRDVFGGNNSNSGSSNKTSAGSSGSSSSSSGSSSGSSKAPVRKF